MRQVNAFVESKIYAEILEYYAIIYLELYDLDLYFTTLPYDITVDGQLYISSVGIVDYSAPSQTSIVDRENFSFSIADPDGSFKERLRVGIAGKAAKMSVGFFNADKTPNTDPENFIISYEGWIDGTSFTSDFEESTINIDCSSPMADLGLIKTMITSSDGMDQFNTNDTSFDNVIANNETKFKWGKE
jgi:hypothetical protein